MHSITSPFFGAGQGKILIQYHNGTSVVYGYILRQLGTSRYRVTTDGTTTYDVLLADNTSLATSLTAGYGTISITPFGGGTEYIRKMEAYRCYTTAGNTYLWVSTATATGQGSFNPIPAAPSIFGSSTGGVHNTTITLDVTGNISGTVTSIAVTVQPAHGVATVNGFVISYLPGSYTGTDGISWVAIGPGGTSNVSQITYNVS